jgi:hypothetical protein
MVSKLRKKVKQLEYSAEGTIEVTQITLFIATKRALNGLTSHSIGSGSLPSQTYGAGPLAYDGVTNNSGNVFSGTSRMDSNRHILVYKGPGVSMFSSANANESLSTYIDKSKMSSCQLQVVIPLAGQNNISAGIDDLRQLRNEYTQGVRKPKTKVEIDEKATTIKIGSSSRLVKLSVQDVVRNENSSKGLVLQAQFKESQASNLLEAAKLAPGRSLVLPIAASLLEALKDLPENALLEPFRKVFSSYPVDDVFLSKRARTLRISNTKVMYARNGLSSIIKNIPVLEPIIANEYIPVIDNFAKELLILAKTQAAAHDIAVSLKKSLATLPQSRPSSESLPISSVDPVSSIIEEEPTEETN